MEHSNYPNYTVIILAIMMLAVGIVIRFIGKRRFNRRGVGGLQQFKSYGVGLATTVIEWVLNIIATLMIIAAIVLFLIR
jgi:hypothetical protein